MITEKEITQAVKNIKKRDYKSGVKTGLLLNILYLFLMCLLLYALHFKSPFALDMLYGASSCLFGSIVILVFLILHNN